MALENNRLPYWRSAISPTSQLHTQLSLHDSYITNPTIRNQYGRLYDKSDPESMLSIRPVCYESMDSGLITPPDTSAVPSPLSQYDYPVFGEIVPENMSFISHSAQESDKAFIEEHQMSPQVNYFLESDSACLHGFEQDTMWRFRHSINHYGGYAYSPSSITHTSATGYTRDVSGSWRGEVPESEQRRPCVQQTMSYLCGPNNTQGSVRA